MKKKTKTNNSSYKTLLLVSTAVFLLSIIVAPAMALAGDAVTSGGTAVSNTLKTTPATTPPATAPAITPASTPKVTVPYVARPYDGINWTGDLTINNPSGQSDLTGLITKLINWMLLVIAMVSTVIIIISGIMLVFNGGSESTVKKAKSSITWAIGGLVVSICAFALVNIIQSLL